VAGAIDLGQTPDLSWIFQVIDGFWSTLNTHSGNATEQLRQINA
jgi:hypothetical protein